MFRVDWYRDALQYQRVEAQDFVHAIGSALAIDVVLESELQRALDGRTRVGVIGVEAEDSLLHLFALAGVVRVEVVRETLEEGGGECVRECRGETLEQREEQRVDALEKRPGRVQEGNGDIVGVEARLRWKKRGKPTSGVG